MDVRHEGSRMEPEDMKELGRWEAADRVEVGPGACEPSIWTTSARQPMGVARI